MLLLFQGSDYQLPDVFLVLKATIGAKQNYEDKKSEPFHPQPGFQGGFSRSEGFYFLFPFNSFAFISSSRDHPTPRPSL